MIEEIGAAQAAEAFSLSAQQKRLWLVQGEDQACRAECMVRIVGDLDVDFLERALHKVVERHEILRTTFRRRRGIRVPFQFVDGDLPVLDRSAMGKSLRDFLESRKADVIDLERGPLVRASILPLGSGEHALYLRLPALCADMAGLENLVEEIGRAYIASRSGTELAGEPLQYLDYSGWQEEELSAGHGDAEKGRAYWARHQGLATELPALPGQRETRTRSAVPSVLVSHLELARTEEIESLAVWFKTSLENVLLASWQILLGRLADRAEVAVAVRFDGRDVEDLRGALGLYARWVPVAVPLDGRRSFGDVLESVAEAREKARRWQAFGDGSGEPPVFPVGFEMEHWPAPRSVGEISLAFEERYVCSEPFRLKLTAIRRPDRLQLELHHDPEMLSEDAAARLARQFETLLGSLVSAPHAPVADLGLLDRQERRLLEEINSECVDFSLLLAVHERFEHQAESGPGEVAAVFEDRRINAAELNADANRLANHLRFLGVGQEVRVAILLERSLDLLAALLGILKAGGAYVPLDPAYPQERLGAMLKSSEAPVLVTRGDLAAGLPVEGLRIVRLDTDAGILARCSAENPRVAVAGENLAYVLFTSGSTGQPKGVAVEHRQLAHYVEAVSHRLGLTPRASYAMVSTFAADLGHTVLFPALCSGGCLHLISQERASSPEALAHYFRRHSIDCMKIVPSHLAALLAGGEPEHLLPRRWLVLGGEACGWALVDGIHRVSPRLTVVNHYGPTETTVGALTRRVEGPETGLRASATVPLGRPLPNGRAFVLDPGLQPLPSGVAGELYLGGPGVTRGYLGRPDLTAERFLPDALSGEPGARLYKTGDRVRVLPEGALEFLGRTDHQVKIRGFRIELGEIETALALHPAVRESVVVLREDKPGERRLAAYLVARAGREAGKEEVRAFLRRRLPEYMVPAALVFLPSLPLTPNGKVDRHSLPVPELAKPERGESATPPRGPVEEALAAIWADVLGLERVGIFDNFFELGGDSILSIEVIAKANRAGLRLSPRQIFQHQTVAELAAVSGMAPEIIAEQGRIEGAVPLTPIQSWFFEQEMAEPHHWNQSVLLEMEQAALGVFDRLCELLAERHDALRLRFEAFQAGWRQFHSGPRGALPWSFVDLSALVEPAQRPAIEAAAALAQTSLHLTEGPLSRLLIFSLGDSRPSRLLWITHHLVVDGVSWRVLLQDLAEIHGALREGRAMERVAKTTSFKAWAERLREQVGAGGLEPQISYWRAALPKVITPLPVDMPGGENRAASMHTVSVALNAEETRALLHEVTAAYRAGIEEVLLAALAVALTGWTGTLSLWVELEGHGREPLFDDLDLSRTVGWFTTHYPVLLELPAANDQVAALAAVKERLRTIPDHGIGFSLLRYLGEGEDAERLRALELPEIVFNYLGRLDQETGEGGPFRPARESSGPSIGARNRRHVLLEVVAAVVEGRLQATWAYGRNLYHETTVSNLAERFKESLRSLIEPGQDAQAGGLTPSDFPLAGLDRGRLDKILKKITQQEG